MDEKDVEAGVPTRIPHFKQVFDPGFVTKEVQEWQYPGTGTPEDPYVVNWIDNDPRNPMNYSKAKKWTLTMLMALATLAVAFVSSAYTGAAEGVIIQFGCSRELFIAGISLCVLGFSFGPMIFSPGSELFGRQPLFIFTYGMLTAFCAGGAGAQNIWTLLILRFFAGFFGSSPLTNSGGVIADMFSARERGLATALFAACPLAGPVIGPIVGGFTGEYAGWRWIFGVQALFTGIVWITASLVVPETYAPVLLRKRAARLSKLTGKDYKSSRDIDQGSITVKQALSTALLRPWVLLFSEPIVALLTLYMAIIYGTLYMLFSAFPIVYQEYRGWSEGIGGLAFIGVAIGIAGGTIFAVFDNKRYAKISDAHKGFAPPEARLPGAMLGSFFIPVSLVWFAWTNSPSIHYLVSIAAGIFFGLGLVLVFLSVFCYLIDAYTIYAASVLAANSLLRSLFGAAFPLFTTQMYSNLGIHWASMIPFFLALACAPFPFLFYKYGAQIRTKCKYAAQSEAFMRKLQSQMLQASGAGESPVEKAVNEPTTGADDSSDQCEKKEVEEEVEPRSRASSTNADAEGFQPIKTTYSRTGNLSRVSTRRSSFGKDMPPTGYEGNPFDLDRVNTRESFPYEAKARSRANSSASATRK